MDEYKQEEVTEVVEQPVAEKELEQEAEQMALADEEAMEETPAAPVVEAAPEIKPMQAKASGVEARPGSRYGGEKKKVHARGRY